MKTVEIIVGDDWKESISLDLNKDSMTVALQYSIDDVRNIDKVSTNHSKTIKLPGTNKNNKAFGNLFDINSTFDKFDPNKKVNASIMVNSSLVLNGFLQLKSVIKDNTSDLQGNHIEYNVIIFDKTIDFIQSIGDKKLINNSLLTDDLDFSDYNHIYNQTNLENAWNNNTYEQVYQYPLMENKNKQYNLTDFKPAVYHKALLLKIAEQAGYTLEGSFINNNDIYDKEIILWNGDVPEINEQLAKLREFNIGSTTTTIQYLGNYTHTGYDTNPNIRYGFLNVDDYSGDHFDNTGGFTSSVPSTTINYDSGTYTTTSDFSKWTCTDTGVYTFYFEGNFTIDYTRQSPYNPTTNEILEVRRRRIGSVISPTPRGGVTMLVRNITTGEVLGGQTKYIDEYEGLGAGVNNKQMISDLNFKVKTASPILEGDDIVIEFRQRNTENGFQWMDREVFFDGDERWDYRPVIITLLLNKDADTVLYNELDRIENIQEGSEIEIGSYLPKELKQKDIISDIIKRYNVFFKTSPNKEKTLILESRDDFYKNYEVLDWTQKKDYSGKDDIKFLTELQNKEILFSYKEANSIEASSGRYNEVYNKETGDIYGQKLINFDNDFVKGVKKITSPLSTIPLVYTGSDEYGGAPVVVPAVSVNEGKRAPILCYWGGLIDNTQDDDGNVRTFNIKYNPNTIISYSQYPYAGHWNNPYTPTIDINYGQITYDFYPQLTQSTTNNLFNRYWRNYYNQISTGKLIISKFYLRESDINFIKDNLNSIIFIKDSYYNINKIIDYKPLEDGLTKVELLRIEEGTSFTPRTSNNRFTRSSVNPSEYLTPSTGPFLSSTSTITESSDVLILGDDNIVSSSEVSAVVIGDDNLVGSGADIVFISGDDNIVNSGVSNVNMFGSGMEATDSFSNMFRGTNTLDGLTLLTGVNELSGVNVLSGETTLEGDVNITGDILMEEINHNDTTIISSTNSSITTSTLDTIISSTTATIDDSQNATIISSNLSDIENGSDNATIMAGRNNTTDNSLMSLISSSFNSTITDSPMGSIISAQNGDVDGVVNGVVIGGVNNTVSAANSTTGGGVIISGVNNTLTNGSALSSILGGQSNILDDAINSSIIGGINNEVNDVNYSTIIVGDSNTIDTVSLNSAIIGGSGNTISNSTSTTIISGLNVTATQDYTLYTPKLVVTQTYVPTSSTDTNGVTGEISYDDDYIYIKTSAGWKRSSLSTF